MKSGSGIDPNGRIPEPVYGQHEPREDSPSGAAGGAAVSSPPPLSPPAALLRQNAVREQAVGGGGTDGSSSAAAGVVDRKGKRPAAALTPEHSPPRSAGGSPATSTSSPDSAWPTGAFDSKQVFDDLVRNQRAINKAHLQFEEEEADERQAKSALWRKFKSYVARKLKIVDREEWIYSEHVGRQTLPITELRQYYRVAEDMAIHVNLDAYSRFRPVLGDGECFYRSFIFSYLDTHEEHRLLDTVKGVSTQHTNLGWISEFSRSYKAFKKLIKNVMGWKRQGRWNSRASTSSYREEKLLEFFSNYKTTEDSEQLVVAIQICSHGDEYEQLITGLNVNNSLKDWCFRRVIPARKFTDHVMMAALGTAFDVPLRVEHLHVVGGAQDIYIGPGVVSVTLLYTGNHYDILYPRAPPAEI